MSHTLKSILAEIRQAKKKQLKELDLSWRWIGQGDRRVLTELFELTNLEVLNLSGNRLVTLPESIGRLQNLKTLDLSTNKLTSIPNSIGQLENLKALNLRLNELTSIPYSIGQLQNLTSLDLRSNRLTTIPDLLGQLQNLTSLDLSSNLLTIIPDLLGQLENLTSLELRSNPLTTIPDSLRQLQNLTLLELSWTAPVSVPDWIAQWKNLRHLGLDGFLLTTIPEWIFQFQELTSLSLNKTDLVLLPDSISLLQNLTELSIGSNNLTSLPDSISKLRNLTTLDLSNTNLTAIPEPIYALRSLVNLWLDNDPQEQVYPNQIKEISSKILQWENLKQLYLEGNPIEIPPPEVVNLDEFGQADIERVKNYFQQLAVAGKDYLYEAKLLVVGEGGAGKTTLAKKIEDATYRLRMNEESTKGIEVIRWEFPLFPSLPGFENLSDMDRDKTFRVNIWDFGGQEIYHATHQFFLTKRSLYILVADTRNEDTDFYYWLNIVELLSDNSPLLIVLNKKQDRHREINERQLRGQFTNLKETLAANLATNRGLVQIVSQIKHYISHLPHIGTELPKTWVKIREILENDPRNYISLEEYLKICRQHGFYQINDSLQLSGYLHDLGVCLHFQTDPLLTKTVILKPEWGTAAVYKVLDDKRVIRNLGRFSRTDLEMIWWEPKYTIMQAELLQLMINFKLCYKIPSSHDYIAPQLLTANQPEYDWPSTNNLILRYTYDFMPKGILTQLIVAMQAWIADQKYVWKSGVILKKDRTAAEVIENYDRREISIHLIGPHKKELLTIITYELDKIHNSYRRLKVNKLIPCNCIVCKASQEPHFYLFDVLRKFIEAGYEQIQCQNGFQMVNVWGLIDDVLDKKRSFRAERDHDYERLLGSKKHVKKLLRTYEGRLQILEEQRAAFGELNVPAHIVLEIEEINAKLEALRTEL